MFQLLIKLKFILPVLLYVLTLPVYASEYNCDPDTVDFNQGDVLSSEVFSEIVDKINSNIVGVSQSELNASWSCKTILRGTGNTSNGYSEDANGLDTMTQTLTFTEVDSMKSRVIYENNLGQGSSQSPAQDCTVSLYASKIKFSNTSDTSCSYNVGSFEIKKKSNSCFEMGHNNSAVSICNKTDIAPDAPLNLFVSLTSTQGTVDYKASLIWEAGDSAQANFDVQRKNTASGTFASIATPTDTNYTDTTITWNNSYWYRVFAVNTDGTSYGSNIKMITYSNTPPSINIPSTISVDENYTSSFTNFNASDADGHTVTFTLESQSPGNDAGDFTLTGDGAGKLWFNAIPDYENPADYDGNNIYDLKLTANDGIESVSQNFSVVVLDVSESN